MRPSVGPDAMPVRRHRVAVGVDADAGQAQLDGVARDGPGLEHRRLGRLVAARGRHDLDLEGAGRALPRGVGRLVADREGLGVVEGRGGDVADEAVGDEGLPGRHVLVGTGAYGEHPGVLVGQVGHEVELVAGGAEVVVEHRDRHGPAGADHGTVASVTGVLSAGPGASVTTTSPSTPERLPLLIV